jgi:hypothetical protein
MSETSFKRTARAVLHERASAFVHACAGHGADVDTIINYTDALAVFESHFAQWSDPLSDTDVLASIPTLHTLMPGVANGLFEDPRPKEASTPYLDSGTSHDVPKPVALVVTLALQGKMMDTNMTGRAVDPAGLNALYSTTKAHRR